jgi:hypothetical protein
MLIFLKGAYDRTENYVKTTKPRVKKLKIIWNEIGVLNV